MLLNAGGRRLRNGKAPKILRQIKNPSGGRVDFSSSNVGIDRYMAIDTSYVPFGENLICATGCLLIDQEIGVGGVIQKGSTLKMFMPPRLVFLAKGDQKPERYGWKRMISTYAGSKLHDKDFSYAVVVDSDLNDHRKIEEGKSSILDDFVLPSNFCLIYANADAGNENIVNKLIRMTDKVARQSLDIAISKFKQRESFVLSKAFWDLEAQIDQIELPR